MASALTLLSLLTAFAAITLFIMVAMIDYQTRKIPNDLVVAGIGLYVLWALSAPAAEPLTDIMVGAGLFAFGFICWMLRLLGAGDAKFMLVCGLFSGLEQLPVFAVWLGLIGVAVYVLVVLTRRVDVTLMLTRLGLRGIEETGKVPYGVPLALATTAAFIARMLPEVAGLG